MPNISAHLYFAERVSPASPVPFLVGSVLPDLIGIARYFHKSDVRVGALRETEFAEGISFHQRTDTAFDNLPLKRGLIHEVLADLPKLREASSGAARACAQAGTDILFDGLLMSDRGLRFVSERARDRILADRNVMEQVDGILPEGLTDQCLRIDARARYSDPVQIAGLLYRRLDQRSGRRLAFEESYLPEVTEAFEQQSERLQRIGKQLVESVVEALQAEPI